MCDDCANKANKQILRTMVSIPFVFPNFHNRFVESPCFHNYLISANENKHSNADRLLPVCAPRKHSCYLVSYKVARAVRSYLPTRHSFYGSKILSLSLRVLYAINSRIFQLTSREQYQLRLFTIVTMFDVIKKSSLSLIAI